MALEQFMGTAKCNLHLVIYVAANYPFKLVAINFKPEHFCMVFSKMLLQLPFVFL